MMNPCYIYVQNFFFCVLQNSVLDKIRMCVVEMLLMKLLTRKCIRSSAWKHECHTFTVVMKME